jgi:hypothetical protein
MVNSLGMGLGSFAKSVGQSAKQGGANLLDKGIDAAANAPQSVKNLGQLMAHGINPESASPGKHENQGGMGGAAGTGYGPTEGERLMKSKNISERVKGMGEQYREKRAEGGKYSGLGGRVKALKSSVAEFHQANKKAAPGALDKKEIDHRHIRRGGKK